MSPRINLNKVSEAIRRANPDLFGGPRIHTPEPEPDSRGSLVSPAKGEGTGKERFSIVFTVHACRPNDWDNVHVKELQDCLVEAGFLPDDNWQVLEGKVIPCKVKTRSEERTVIEIEKIQDQIHGSRVVGEAPEQPDRTPGEAEKTG